MDTQDFQRQVSEFYQLADQVKALLAELTGTVSEERVPEQERLLRLQERLGRLRQAYGQLRRTAGGCG